MVLLVRLFLIATFLAMAAPAWAQTIDDAVSLYDSGDHDAAFQAFSTLVAEGDAEAMCRIGRMYENGEGTAQNYSMALRWYRRAANQDHAEAHFNVGRMFENSIGVPRDFKAAFEAYTAAADLGHETAGLKQAEFLARGLGTYPDVARAAELLGQAADAGNDEAFDALVELWDTGEVPKGVLSDDIIARMEIVLADRMAEDTLIDYGGDAPAAESETAAMIREQIVTMMDSLAQGVRQEGGDVFYRLDITETDDGRIDAALRDVELFSPDGLWEIGDALLVLQPIAEARFAIDLTLPAETRFFDQNGAAMGGTSLGNQALSGVFVPELNTWVDGEGLYEDVRIWFDTPDGHGSFDLAKATLFIDLDETTPDKWSGPGSFNLSGIEMILDGEPLFRLASLASTFDYRALDLGFFYEINAAMQDIQAGMIENPSKNDDELQAEMTAVGELIVEQVRERAPVMGGFGMDFALDGLWIRDPALHGIIAFDTLSFGVSAENFDQALGSVVLSYGHSGMVVPVEDSEGELLPTSIDLRFRLADLPVDRIAAMAIEMMEGAIADPAAFEQQAEMALGFMALGMQQQMMQAGSAFEIERISYESPIVQAEMTGRFVSDDSSPMMTVGSARLEVTGLDDAIASLEGPASQGNRDAQDAMEGLAMMQAMGARSDQGGVVTHTYDFEFTPDGRVLLNGNDMSPMMGGMMP